MGRDMVAARPHQEIVKTKALDFLDAPRRNPFTPNSVFIDLGSLQKQDLGARTDHGDREGATADPSSNDDKIIVHRGILPAILLQREQPYSREHKPDLAS